MRYRAAFSALMFWVAHNALDGATNYTIVVIATSALLVCIAAYNNYLAIIEARQREWQRDHEAQARRRCEVLQAAQHQLAETQRLDEDRRML